MWYYAFSAAVFLLWIGARPKDREALAIVALATLASALLVALWTSNLTSPLKLAVPASVETITCVLLLGMASSRIALFQAVLVTVAWCCHYLCFTDLIYDQNAVYDNYETILAVIAIAQLLAFHDTYLHHIRSWWSALGEYRTGPVPAPRVPVAVLSDSSPNHL